MRCHFLTFAIDDVIYLCKVYRNIVRGLTMLQFEFTTTQVTSELIDKNMQFAVGEPTVCDLLQNLLPCTNNQVQVYNLYRALQA